jgi:hypothetical protein
MFITRDVGHISFIVDPKQTMASWPQMEDCEDIISNMKSLA